MHIDFPVLIQFDLQNKQKKKKKHKETQYKH